MYNTNGLADIIIRAFDDYSSQGKTFKKGQVITIIRDVDFSIEYGSLNKEIAAKTALLGHSDFFPERINIRASGISKSLTQILYLNKTAKKLVYVPIWETIKTDENGVAFLNKVPSAFRLNIMDMDLNPVDYEVDEIGKISNLAAETNYFACYYTVEKVKEGYNLGKTYNPYFSIEIKNKENIGKIGSNSLITIPKTALSIDPTYDYDKASMTEVSLSFLIIDGKAEIIYY